MKQYSEFGMLSELPIAQSSACLEFPGAQKNVSHFVDHFSFLTLSIFHAILEDPHCGIHY